MTVAITLPTAITANCIGLDVWMDRVLKEAEKVRSGWNVLDVHDLRVALRGCRTMADALTEVNPGPGWRKRKESTRMSSLALGALHDAQVDRTWLKKLGLPGAPVRKHLLTLLSRQQEKH